MNTNQKNLVLNHLKQGQTLTQAEAIKYFNCYRLSAVIKYLRNVCYDIETHRVNNHVGNGSYARYELRSLVK